VQVSEHLLHCLAGVIAIQEQRTLGIFHLTICKKPHSQHDDGADDVDIQASNWYSNEVPSVVSATL
jgi:hypothetical protein